MKNIKYKYKQRILEHMIDHYQSISADSNAEEHSQIDTILNQEFDHTQLFELTDLNK